MQNSILRDVIERELWILNLTKREEKVLKLRKGGSTLRAIGLELNLTQERVRQIEEKAKKQKEFKDKIMKGLLRKIEKYLKKQKNAKTNTH